jgi:hypothetical protein
MSNLTSSLTIKLIDGVSGPAKTVANALKSAENNAKAVAKAMSGTGARDGFQRQLAGLKLAGKDIEQVAKAWKDYARSAGLAANASSWTKNQAAGVRAWEQQTIRALRAVKREQIAFNRSIAGAGGVSPMMLAMSQSTLANRKMVAGMSAAGARRALAGAKASSIGAAEYAAGAGLLGRISLPGVTAGYAAYQVGSKVAAGGAEYQHQRVAALNAGMSPSELKQAEAAAIAAQRHAPTMTVSEIMALLQDVRSSVQDQADVYRILPQVAKAASALKAMGAHEANVGDIVKAGDTLGLLTQPGRFEKFLSGQVKAQAVLGRTVSTEGVYEAAKYSKTAGAALSDKFLNLVMPGLIQELHGSSAGDTLSMLTKTLRGGLQSKHLPVMKLKELGLLEDPSKIVYSKTGSIKGYLGKVVNDALLASDPDQWFQKIFKPAAEGKGGVKNMADMVSLLSTVLPSRAANLARILMQQEQSLKTQAELFEKTPDMDQMIKNQRADPKAAWEGLKSATENLGAAALSAIPAAEALNKLSGAMDAYSDMLRRKPQKTDFVQMVGEAAGTLKKDAIDSAKKWWNGPTPSMGAGSLANYEERLGLDGKRKTFLPSMLQDPKAMSIEVKPTVDTSSLDAAKGVAEGTKAAVEGLAITVSPTVNTGSISAAKGEAQSLLSILQQISGAAAGATGQVNALSAAAGVAASKVGNLKAVQNSNFTASSQKGE